MTLVEQYNKLKNKSKLTADEEFLVNLFELGILHENPTDTFKNLFKRMYDEDYPEESISDELKNKLTEVLNSINEDTEIEEFLSQQRADRGYSNRDVCEFCYWFTRIISKMLIQLAVETEHTSSIVENEDGNIEDWQNILLEMSYHLNEMNEYTCSFENPYEKEMDEKYDAEAAKTSVELQLLKEKFTKYELIKHIYLNSHKQEFFNLFSKYFYDLWL